MNQEINKYKLLIDRIALSYQYNNNIKHLLTIIIPAFIKKYGIKNERLILNVFENTKILIKEDSSSIEEAYYTSIPYYKENQLKTKKLIILTKYQQNNLVQLLDNLIHEFNHAIHSYKKEITIKDNILALRTGLTKIYYSIPDLKGIKKENTYLLEEILNTIQTEEIINIIKNFPQTTNEEVNNLIQAINQETNKVYKSKSYYLETILFKHILKNKTFTYTLNNLRLSGDIDDIEEWFNHITGNKNDYQTLNNNLIQLMNLELELTKKKHFKILTIHKIKKQLNQCIIIINTFNQNCHYK